MPDRVLVTWSEPLLVQSIQRLKCLTLLQRSLPVLLVCATEVSVHPLLPATSADTGSCDAASYMCTCAHGTQRSRHSYPDTHNNSLLHYTLALGYREATRSSSSLDENLRDSDSSPYPFARRMGDTSTMATGSWREMLQQAFESNKHLKHHTHIQMATVRPDGRPANRTIVFRGFVEGTDKFLFTTDARSAKIDDIKHCSFGEICYYFTDSSEQFRIHGQLDLIGHADADPAKESLREKAWFNIALQARAAFSLPYPGLVKSDTPLIDPDQGPLDTFCVFTLEPEQIKYYNARDAVCFVFKSSETSSGQRDWSREEVE